MSKLPIRNSNIRRSRCCGGVSIFFLLASLGYIMLFYRLEFCRDCIPSTWLETVLTLEVATNFSSDVLGSDDFLQVSEVGSIEQKIRRDSSGLEVQRESIEPNIQPSLSQPEEAQESTEHVQDELQHEISNEQANSFKVAMNSSIFNITRKWVYSVRAWRPALASSIKTPFPVFVASLPKSGTTSISNYFMCGGVRSVHTFCPFKTPDGRGQVRIGVLVKENIKEGVPPFEGCGKGFRPSQGPVNVYSDTGYADPGHACYYPSIHALEEMYEAFPNMTILLGTRDSTQWYNSVKSWGGGSLLKRWIKFCSAMPDNDDSKEFIEFYEWHNRHIRNFANSHPSITFVEARIDTPNSGEVLEKMTNISSSCWGHFIPTGVRVRLNKTIGRIKSSRRVKASLKNGINQRIRSNQKTRKHLRMKGDETEEP